MKNCDSADQHESAQTDPFDRCLPSSARAFEEVRLAKRLILIAVGVDEDSSSGSALFCDRVWGQPRSRAAIRVLILEAALGKTIAAVCEAPFLLVAMIAAAYWIPKKMGSDTSLASLAAIGIGALVLRQIADFTVGVGLRGISADEQLRYLTTPPGLIYVALLILFGAMPVVVNTHRRR